MGASGERAASTDPVAPAEDPETGLFCFVDRVRAGCLYGQHPVGVTTIWRIKAHGLGAIRGRPGLPAAPMGNLPQRRRGS